MPKKQKMSECFFSHPNIYCRTFKILLLCPFIIEPFFCRFFGIRQNSIRYPTNAALFGDPYETRTRVTAVKGRCLRPLDQGAVFIGISRNLSFVRSYRFVVAAVRFEPTTCRV